MKVPTPDASSYECPFGGLRALAHLAFQEVPHEIPHRCEGANCMMWRYTDEPIKTGPYADEYYGYCGLAGKPE